jgi:hypothetical protein
MLMASRVESILTHMKRAARKARKPVTTLMAVEAIVLSAVAFIATAPPALAGDSYPQGSNGDCWRVGTPEMCRTTWTGKNSSIYMRMIDQLGDNTLHNYAGTACSNWNTAPGPQFCSYNAGSRDTWTYLKINDFLSAPNGLTYNCVNGSCPTSNNAGNILWTEIYVPHANGQSSTNPCNNKNQVWAVQVFAHELGHAYGLAHHGAACANITLMTQGDVGNFMGPTNTDIGPFPGCSGAAGTGGVRCIYEQVI